MVFRCEICNKEFGDENGLNMHTAMKHPKQEKKPFAYGKIVFFVIIIVVIGFVVWLITAISAEKQACLTASIEELFIKSHTETKSHYHAELEIIIDGKTYDIPANIGVELEKMRPVHTHDATGELHVEGPCIRDFTLGDFFKIWNKQFNNNCIFGFCTDNGSKGILTMTVNGINNQEFENLVLRDDQKIKIEYVSG